MRKTIIRSLMQQNYFLMAVLAAILSLGANSAFSAAKETIHDVIVYKQPPTAYELAHTLFPPRTRSIILDSEPQPVLQPASVAFMIKFEYDSINVRPKSRPYLDALGDMLNFDKLKDKTLMIEGHADASGEANYNLKLSEARAQAIKKYLTSVHRIDPERLYTMGYGEARLLDWNSPAAQVNRRAEFKPWQPKMN